MSLPNEASSTSTTFARGQGVFDPVPSSPLTSCPPSPGSCHASVEVPRSPEAGPSQSASTKDQAPAAQVTAAAQAAERSDRRLPNLADIAPVRERESSQVDDRAGIEAQMLLPLEAWTRVATILHAQSGPGGLTAFRAACASFWDASAKPMNTRITIRKLGWPVSFDDPVRALGATTRTSGMIVDVNCLLDSKRTIGRLGQVKYKPEALSVFKHALRFLTGLRHCVIIELAQPIAASSHSASQLLQMVQNGFTALPALRQLIIGGTATARLMEEDVGSTDPLAITVQTILLSPRLTTLCLIYPQDQYMTRGGDLLPTLLLRPTSIKEVHLSNVEDTDLLGVPGANHVIQFSGHNHPGLDMVRMGEIFTPRQRQLYFFLLNTMRKGVGSYTFLPATNGFILADMLKALLDPAVLDGDEERGMVREMCQQAGFPGSKEFRAALRTRVNQVGHGQVEGCGSCNLMTAPASDEGELAEEEAEALKVEVSLPDDWDYEEEEEDDEEEEE